MSRWWRSGAAGREKGELLDPEYNLVCVPVWGGGGVSIGFGCVSGFSFEAGEVVTQCYGSPD